MTRGSLVLLGTIAAVAPVTLRNRIVAGDWVLICMAGGPNFWMANHSAADGKDPSMIVEDDDKAEDVLVLDSKDPWEWDLNCQVGTKYIRRKFGKELSFGQVGDKFFQMARDHIFQHPGEFLALTLKRLVWTFNAYEHPSNNDQYEFCRFSSLLRGLSYAHFGVICPLALLGVATALRSSRHRTIGLVCYVTLGVTVLATGAVFAVNSRYRLPTVVLLLPFAGYGILQFVQALHHPPAPVRSRLVMAGGLAVLVIFCNANLFGYRPPRRPAHMDWLFAYACELCNEKELLDEAMPALGDALIAELEFESAGARRSATSILRRYAQPFAALVQHFRRKGDLEKVILYGSYMARYEPYNETNIHMYAAWVLSETAKSGRPVMAYKLLDGLGPVLNEHNPKLLGELLSTAQYVTRKSLVEAIQQATQTRRPQIVLDALEELAPALAQHDPKLGRELCHMGEVKLGEYFGERLHMAVQTNQPQIAYEALERLRPILTKFHPELLADLSLVLGNGTKDHRLLEYAVKTFEDLAAENPGESRYQDKLLQARQALESVSSKVPPSR